MTYDEAHILMIIMYLFKLGLVILLGSKVAF